MKAGKKQAEGNKLRNQLRIANFGYRLYIELGIRHCFLFCFCLDHLIEYDLHFYDV